jgi:phage terminase large subunit
MWLIDPTWARQRNAETHKTGTQLYRENGVPVRPAELDEDFGVLASREYINATLDPTSRHPKLYVFKGRCPNFEYEVEHYTWDVYGKGDKKGLSKEKPVKRNDHLLNAFQYLSGMRPKSRRNRTYAMDRQQYSQVNSY